jgi:hypothetical protein
MNYDEEEKFESELRRVKLVQLPEALVRRLHTMGTPHRARSSGLAPSQATVPKLMHILRWLIPATAVLLAAAVIWRDNPAVIHQQAAPKSSPQVAEGTVSPVLRADDVQIGRQLVSSFDAVATLPGGEPVRFRCERWMDQVVLSDKSRGLLVENWTPRVEVVPVGFETY